MNSNLKKILICGLFAGTTFTASAQNSTKQANKTYTMKKYVFVLLKTGPNRSHDSTTAAKIQEGHMANINKLANEKKLVVAGPFLDKTEARGIFIFNLESVEEVKELLKTDPAISSGRLEAEVHPWYSSDKIAKLLD